MYSKVNQLYVYICTLSGEFLPIVPKDFGQDQIARIFCLHGPHECQLTVCVRESRNHLKSQLLSISIIPAHINYIKYPIKVHERKEIT